MKPGDDLHIEPEWLRGADLDEETIDERAYRMSDRELARQERPPRFSRRDWCRM